MRLFREIERLRGLAILLAVFNHEPLHNLVPWFSGVVGVHLFFVISGFVITLSLERLRETGEHPLRTFYARRFFRLFPMAAVSILLALTAAEWLNQALYWHSPAAIARQALATVTLNYNYRTYTLGWDLVYFWSLNVEEHFYLGLPLALAFAAHRRWSTEKLLAAFGAAWVAATCVRLLTAPSTFEPTSFWQNHFSTHARLDCLIAGVMLAILHRAQLFERPSASAEMRVAGRLAAGAAVVGLAGVHSVSHWLSSWSWSFVELCSVVLVGLASFRRHYVLQAPLLSPALEWLGARAYTIYLLHLGLGRVLGELINRPPFSASLFPAWGIHLVYSALVLGASALAYQAIERPLTDYGRRLTTGQRTTARAADVPRAA